MSELISAFPQIRAHFPVGKLAHKLFILLNIIVGITCQYRDFKGGFARAVDGAQPVAIRDRCTIIAGAVPNLTHQGHLQIGQRGISVVEPAHRPWIHKQKLARLPVALNIAECDRELLLLGLLQTHSYRAYVATAIRIWKLWHLVPAAVVIEDCNTTAVFFIVFPLGIKGVDPVVVVPVVAAVSLGAWSDIPEVPQLIGEGGACV